MKYYFPLHFDGGNRGCEGIAKGTAVILGEKKDNLVAYCRNVPLDSSLGIDQYMTLQEYKPIKYVDKLGKVMENILTAGKHKGYIYFKYVYRSFLSQITVNDIMLSTGGDMLCYGNNMVNTTNNMLHKRGVKTILWGCSMGPENYTPEKYDTLKRFSLIYARESLTYEYFRSLGLNNVVCLPDPAFVLKPTQTDLPCCFTKGDVIGINLSPYVLKGQNLTTSFGGSIKKLFDYIINNTEMQILLIPHVLWPGQDDKKVAENVASIYKNSERVSVLDISALNYLQIRHIISRCKFFIGGRTHAVISAYSTCVPTIALGYSIKSRGIAKDLGLSNELVVDTRDDREYAKLLSSFDYLMDQECKIKKHLESVIPIYSKRPTTINEIISNLF